MTRILNLDRWAGRWVAVSMDGQVVADSATMRELYERLKRTGVVEVEIMRALAPHQPVVFGSG